MLGLPPEVTACLFDLDGVLTRTAVVHAKAWKETFDGFMEARAKEMGEPFVPFTNGDYDRYVDGRPRLDGTRNFLQSRGIELPEGDPSDPPDAPTINGVSNRKNERVLQLLAEGKVEVYDGSVEYVRQARQQGLRTAVVSSSANTAQVLESAGIADLFEARIDGLVAIERKLNGKPAPDTFLAGAQALGATPGQAAVFEDALAGVEAGRAGGFGCVVGVDRLGGGPDRDLLAHGATVVVKDLEELL